MKPQRLHALLAMRLLLLSGPLLLSWAPAGAAGGRGVEVTPYAGYAVGGRFDDEASGSDLDLEGGGSFGFILGLSQTHETQYEVFYGLQKTRVAGGGEFEGETPFDLDIHYLHLGGIYMPQKERVRPFVAGGLGATQLVPHASGMSSKTYFSLSLGGGAKVPVSARVSLRFEARGFMTILPDRGEAFCQVSNGSRCGANTTGDLLGRFQVLAGLTFSSKDGADKVMQSHH